SAQLSFEALLPGELRTWNHVLAKMIEVRGHVYGEKSGNPLEGVRVRAHKVGSSAKPVTAGVEDDGSYELSLAAGPGLYRISPEFKFVWERHPDRFGKDVMLSGGENSPVDLTFVDPVTLSLHVEDPEGGPVGGAEISLTITSGTGGGSGYGRFDYTDDSGNFTWSGFAPETKYTLFVKTDEHVRTGAGPFNGKPGEIFPRGIIVLHKNSGMTGVALSPEGDVLANSRLTINVTDGMGQTWTIIRKTNGTGVFKIREELPATTVSLEITANAGRKKLSWTSEGIDFLPGQIAELGELVLDEIQTRDAR
ncbi:hypothetical protein ACFL1X_14950, partial [Candidatus Hydrogenedentota bacterium]